jgi:hypothetical protein
VSVSTLISIVAIAALGCGHAQDVMRAKPLFCAYGGVGLVPDPLPAGYETEFAVAVVEVHSVTETASNAVTQFILFDKDGAETKMKRVVETEIFERPRVASEGEFAWYLNPGGTRPWDGRLPAGTVRIRLRVALERAPAAPVRFRLKIGSQSLEGIVDGSWPT